MKYISKFETEADYTTAKSNFDRPHVSLVSATMDVLYDPLPPAPVGPPNDEIWYTTTDGEPIEFGGGSGSGSGSGEDWPEHTNTYEGGKGVIKFAENLTEIPYAGFSLIGNLETIVLPNGVISIGGHAFYCCSGLTSITIPNSVTSIGEGAFAYCAGGSAEVPGLTSITIPNSVTSIGEGAFHSCSRLTSVTIGNSVTSIGEFAFSDCYRLTSITCETTTPPTLGGDDVFKSTNNCPIYVPTDSVEAYESSWVAYASRIRAIQ